MEYKVIKKFPLTCMTIVRLSISRVATKNAFARYLSGDEEGTLGKVRSSMRYCLTIL